MSSMEFNPTTDLLVIVAGFLMGAIPFGVLFTRSRGIDLRKVGSGNTGATNVLRAAGKKIALLTLLCDILKGTAAVALAQYMGLSPLMEGLAGLASVAGHNFTPFLGFRGGKGVATSVGVVLIYVPLAGLITVVVWLAVVLSTRISSLGALVAFTVLPFAVRGSGFEWEKFIISVIITLLLLIRHKQNIVNLMAGTERRVGDKKQGTP